MNGNGGFTTKDFEIKTAILALAILLLLAAAIYFGSANNANIPRP